MLRYLAVTFFTLVLLLVGCSKDEEEIRAIEKEATETGAAAVTDSLERPDWKAAQAKDTATTTERQQPARPRQPDYSDLEGYVVQIGSYSSYDFAQMMAEKYQQRDFPAFVQAAELDGQTYYRLRIGVYETVQDAKVIGDILNDRYSADYWIDFNR